ncbi:MAG TPA: hypothetical protein DD723_01150 [Candidatus Omnitrophica bacterium]|nr:hypothetical protein [Candidatus Omnitrophota bacterium]
MMWYVYILKTKRGSLYTGITTCLERRLNEHRRGRGGRFTKTFGVDQLLYSETCLNQSEALRREAEIKAWPRVKKMKLIGG